MLYMSTQEPEDQLKAELRLLCSSRGRVIIVLMMVNHTNDNNNNDS